MKLHTGLRWGSSPRGLSPRPHKGDVERFTRHARRMASARTVVLPVREGERLGLTFAGFGCNGMPSSDEVRAAGYRVMTRPRSTEHLTEQRVAGGNPLAIFHMTDELRAQWAALADEGEAYAQGSLIEETAA